MLRSLLRTAACSSVSDATGSGLAGRAGPATATRRRSATSRVGFAAAVPGLPSIGQQMSGAPPPVDFIRTLAHPILEPTGASASVRATIAAVAGSKDASDERVLPPVPISPRPNRGPYNITDDSIIEYPRSDRSVAEQASFIDVQVPKNYRNSIVRQIIENLKRRLFKPTNWKPVISRDQNFFECVPDFLLLRKTGHP